MTETTREPPDSDSIGGPALAMAPSGGRRRSRVVLWATLVTAVVLAALIAVLASSKSVSSSESASPLIGKAAPAISGRALNLPGTYQLSQYAGKWVLVNFEASWCQPCQLETPQLAAFVKEHSVSGNAVVLAVQYDPSDTSSLTKFLKSNHVGWPTVADPQADVSYGVTAGLPESYLVAPSGIVVAKYFGEITAAQVDKVIGQLSQNG